MSYLWLNSSGLVSAFLLKSSMSVSDLSEPSGSSPRSAASSSAMARTWWLGSGWVIIVSPLELQTKVPEDFAMSPSFAALFAMSPLEAAAAPDDPDPELVCGPGEPGGLPAGDLPRLQR